MNYGENINASYADDQSYVSGFDRYSNLAGTNSCSAYAEYSTSSMPYTPSACNFMDDYAPVSDEYNATPIPVMAALQYYPWNNVVQVNDGKIFAPKIVDVQGTVVQPKKGGMNVQADQFNSLLGQYISGSFDDRIATLQARLAQLQSQPQTPQNGVNMKAIQDSINTLQAAKMAGALSAATPSAQQASTPAAQATQAIQQLAQAAASPAAAPVQAVQQAAQVASTAIPPNNAQAQQAVQQLAQAAATPAPAPAQAVQQAAQTAVTGVQQGAQEGFWWLSRK